MTADETLVIRLATEIEAEIASIEKLHAEFEQTPRDSTESFSLRARASILHDFYTGVERIFVRIAEELNGGVPRSEQWYRQLLTDMTLELKSVRPEVISKDCAAELGEFLRFRHLFRNLYGFVLDPNRIIALESRFPDTFQHFKRDIRIFVEWLRSSP